MHIYMNRRNASSSATGSRLGGAVALPVLLAIASVPAFLHSSSIVPTGVADAFIPTSRIASKAALASSSTSSSSLSYASSLPPEVHESTLSFLQKDEVLRKKRHNLKRRLLDAADEYRIQRQIDELFQDQMVVGSGVDKSNNKDSDQTSGYTVTRLLRRIVAKITGKQRPGNPKKNKSVITTDKFRQKTLDVGDEGRAIIDLAEELIKLNPTPNPTHGFRGYSGGNPSDCKLSGKWKLRFTTAADASFDRNNKRGKISTSQEIDCEEGTLTNVVDFEQGKLHGFRVVVKGTPVSDTELDLSFKRVDILRKSRFPRLLGRLSFRLPSRLLRRLNRDGNERGPYLTIKYLDEDLRIHKSGTGNYFIQSRAQ